jgi:hypothetical protein
MHLAQKEACDAMSTALLNTVLEKVIRNIETNLNGTIFNKMRQYIAVFTKLLCLRTPFGSEK